MTTVVVDASALVEYLFRTAKGRSLEGTLTNPSIDLHTPSLCDVEIVSALRGSLLRGLLSGSRALQCLDDYLDLPLTRHGHQSLLPQTLEMYETISAYDGIYVALAEGLGAPLLTADIRLTRGAERLGVACL